MIRLETISTNIKNVWILTFELDEFARVGGLGKAVALFIKTLTKKGLKVTVFTPSHGRHLSDEFRFRFNLRNLDDFAVEDYRKGLDGNIYYYRVGAEEGTYHGARLIVFKGLDYETGRFIDSWEIYRDLPEKVCLFSRAIRHWVEYSKELPDMLHSNDWTSGLAGSLLKIYLEMKGIKIPYLHSIHLLSSPSFPWHYASDRWCGIPNTPHKVWVGYKHDVLNTEHVWDSVYGNVDNFTILEADALASNSYGYLNEILSKFGKWLEPKTCVIHNVTDWDVNTVKDIALKYVGNTSRKAVRSYIINYIHNNDNLIKLGNLDKCEFLIATSGRITWQKGFDILIKSLDYVDHRIGVIIAGIRIGDKDFEEHLSKLVREKSGRALLLLSGINEWILKLIVYSANIYSALSRYEPFGIVSIEAQALGTPVVVSNVGGLPETVLDLKYNVNGSGTCVSLDDIVVVAETLESMIFLTEIIDSNRHDLINNIKLGWIKNLVINVKNLDLRTNAIIWVNSKFREDNLWEDLMKCYEKAKLYSHYRTL
ncbi:MAG: glycogen/starch synthase [Sulfolobales archaeon]